MSVRGKIPLAVESKLKTKVSKLPNEPGVYIFFDNTGEVIYAGKSVSLKKRVISYFTYKDLGQKTAAMVKKIADVKFIKVFSEFEALLLESELIKKYKPFFNVQAKDDKSPLYIKIEDNQIPLVTTVRKDQAQKNVFVKGPFPSGAKTRQVLKIIRKIFPYCHHKNPKRPCLYVHLGLCPYPYQSPEAKTKYLSTVKKIKQLLSGKTSMLIKKLTGEMQSLSNQKKYEEAQAVKYQIENIQKILREYTSPAEFIQTPTLVDDLTLMRLKDLKDNLDLPHVPKRMECYDISNLGGLQATGSMAVFTNGLPDKSQYRRFKIKFAHKPDDYEMLREVLTRRLKNKWQLPDLIIVDGGRGQLNSALSILAKFKVSIPVISLAKRFEDIYTPKKVIPVSLPKESPARQLLQSIRDEAHRFAVNYHRLLRSKAFLN